MLKYNIWHMGHTKAMTILRQIFTYVFDDEISKTLNEIVKIQKLEKKEVSYLQKAFFFFFFKKIKKIFLVPKL